MLNMLITQPTVSNKLNDVGSISVEFIDQGCSFFRSLFTSTYQLLWTDWTGCIITYNLVINSIVAKLQLEDADVGHIKTNTIAI